MKPDLFHHLFESTSLHDPPWYVESGLVDYVCNRSLSEINAKITVLMLKVAAAEAHFCDTNERPVLNPVTGLFDCVCQPDKTCEQNIGENQFEKAMLAFLVLAAFAWLVHKFIEIVWVRRPPA